MSYTSSPQKNLEMAGLFAPVEASSISLPRMESRSPKEGEEQALESHEVIELQMFSERKNWIEDKIKFLEKMPPVEVFVGSSALRSSPEKEVPGLPTREELKQWMVEHDVIEKETEIFDTGALRKLKKFTKAAAQRNLSSEDTDLIELTLTTIYELDKLFHLLRDRSENLELLQVRLTWEEYRISAWKERRNLISDINTFLATRARWNPDVYETLTTPSPPEPSLKRRDSVVSIASVASSASGAPPAFSRSARFKFAELLSRDAAQFVGRVTSLRHGTISGAGKALDKLIDRKSVPDEFLDEQDLLEEKGITEMENIGKFVMNVVMQWRKADDIYVETTRDYDAAQALLEEIEMALFDHPTSRQSSSFLSRADALVKRLGLRGNFEFESPHSFPQPTHPLFIDQGEVNKSLVNSLSSEIKSCTEVVSKADALAKAYRSSYEAVRRVENISQSIKQLTGTLNSINTRLEQGFSVDEGDGSPPDLTSETCLEATRHAVFLALLPPVLEEASKAIGESKQLARSSKPALIALERPGIDRGFKIGVADEINQMLTLCDQSQHVRDVVSARVARLREARRIWVAMDSEYKRLEGIRLQIGDSMERQRWSRTADNDRPLTPDSPSEENQSPLSPSSDFLSQLDGMNLQVVQEVEMPLAALSPTLEASLHAYFTQSLTGLMNQLESIRQMAHLLRSIRAQAAAMASIRIDFNDYHSQIDDLKMRYDTTTQQILDGNLSGIAQGELKTELSVKAEQISDKVRLFNESLSARVIFTARRELSSPGATFTRRRFSSVDVKLGTQLLPSIELPFDLALLDNAVRSDSNSYSMTLSGELSSLKQKQHHLELASMAKEADWATGLIVSDISQVVQRHNSFKDCLARALETEDKNRLLDELLREMEASSQQDRSRISRSFSPIRDLLHRMGTSPGAHDPTVHEIILIARMRATDDAEYKFNSWSEDVAILKNSISEAQRAETQRLAQRLERIRIEEENRLREEDKRLAAEEMERSRVEQEKLLVEQRVKEEAERLAEKGRLEAERQRLAAEEVLKARQEQERLEAEVRLRIEQERIEEERRLQAERERDAEKEAESARKEREWLDRERRRVEEEADQLRLERERLIEEAKRRSEEYQAEERRLEVERKLVVAEQAKRLQLEKERLEEEKRTRLEEQKRRREELERRRQEADEAEQVRLERERLSTLEKAREKEARLAEEVRLEEERSWWANEEQRLRARHEQLDRDSRERDKATREFEERCLQAERDQLDTRKVEIERLRVQTEARIKAEDDQTIEELGMVERRRRALEEMERVQLERQQSDKEGRAGIVPRSNGSGVRPKAIRPPQIPAEEIEDVFGVRISPTDGHKKNQRSQENVELQAIVLGLRNRLRSLSINCTARTQSSSSSKRLPNHETAAYLDSEFSKIVCEFSKLLSSMGDPPAVVEMRSLRVEIEVSRELLQRIQKLATLSDAIQQCDVALSDLLEHVDSYPSHPLGLTESSFIPVLDLPPEDQLSSRLSFTKSAMEDMRKKVSEVAVDSRAIAELKRLNQTYKELQDMCNDRLQGKKSRPGSVLSNWNGHSNGRNSRASVSPSPLAGRRKTGYSNLSLGSSTRGGRLGVPSFPSSKRSLSSSGDPHKRPLSQISNVSSTRSVSGPLSSSSGLYGSTFASRQRTSSLSSNPASPAPMKKSPAINLHQRTNSARTDKVNSPSLSETSSLSNSINSSRPASSWARAPRNSLTSMPQFKTPPRKKSTPKKAYIADPNSRLDVAVGDVVNKLPVNINIEVVAETWKDQSGKYWIGDEDPKLCFCRILRSQTVMVRVGGGWVELSKFIKDHFADLFRLIPESPPRNGQEEKWITSQTLQEAPEISDPLPPPPRTPEPKAPFVPSFSLQTPTARSPRSIKSTSPGSPLVPLQFMRRAESEFSNRPSTPSKSSGGTLRLRPPIGHTLSRASVWRP